MTQISSNTNQENFSYSDSSAKKSPVVVRMQGLFGQLSPRNRLLLSEWRGYSDSSAQEIACCCPNGGVIRTAQPKKSPVVVRMQRLFGQLSPRNRLLLSEWRGYSDSSAQEIACCCPNGGVIRTAQPKKSPVVVRMQGLFGQLSPRNRLLLSEWRGYSDSSAQEIACCCPNGGVIRTAQPKKSPVVVRMQGLFGQLSPRNRLLLSEWRGYSDSSAQEIACCCPNGGVIRTAQPRNRLLLSECRGFVLEKPSEGRLRQIFGLK